MHLAPVNNESVVPVTYSFFYHPFVLLTRGTEHTEKTGDLYDSLCVLCVSVVKAFTQKDLFWFHLRASDFICVQQMFLTLYSPISFWRHNLIITIFNLQHQIP